MNGFMGSRALGSSFGKGFGSFSKSVRCSSTSSTSTPSVKSGNTVWKAAITSGSLSLAGDVLAQVLTTHFSKEDGKKKEWRLEPARMARMATFGLFFYGPYQFHWYNLLERRFPLRTASHFLSKVALNQLALSPVVLSVVFSWNLALTGQAKKIPEKLKSDLVPTMINGWKFWVPASSVNFWAVPLKYQVLYMSSCGVLWTAYLSYCSNLA